MLLSCWCLHQIESHLGVAIAPHLKAREGQRICLCDITRSGKKDLVIGNYLGEIMLIPNAGSGVKPDYRQPSNIASVIIPTMKDSLKKWGNLFAPAVWDWNRDGKDDRAVIVGRSSVGILGRPGAHPDSARCCRADCC